MTEAVKPRRRYESRRRAEQAERTRTDILEAAGVLFRDQGYGVPMPAIAARAGVVVETVYRIFGSKASLFTAVVEALLAGGPARAAIPVEDRPAIRAVRDEPDPRKQDARYAATQPGIHRRAGPLLRALRDAKAGDAELTRLWDDLEAWRYDGQGRFAERLAEEGALRPELPIAEAKDVLWTLCSLATYDSLVRDRGWTDKRYEAWLSSSLAVELLGC